MPPKTSKVTCAPGNRKVSESVVRKRTRTNKGVVQLAGGNLVGSKLKYAQDSWEWVDEVHTDVHTESQSPDPGKPSIVSSYTVVPPKLKFKRSKESSNKALQTNWERGLPQALVRPPFPPFFAPARTFGHAVAWHRLYSVVHRLHASDHVSALTDVSMCSGRASSILSP